jgi:hypothetical protein
MECVSWILCSHRVRKYNIYPIFVATFSRNLAMRKIYFFLFGTVIFVSSCQKSISDFDPTQQPGTGTGTTPTTPGAASGSFAATINGKQQNFTVTSATLIRSAIYNEKRLDIAGTSADGTKKIIITLGEETSVGNAVTVKSYVLNAFPPDDPSTPNIDESLTTQGFTTYGILNAGNWEYDVYDEDGSFAVTSCSATTTLISGTFQTMLTDLNDSTHIIKITAGAVNNVKYTVLN